MKWISFILFISLFAVGCNQTVVKKNAYNNYPSQNLKNLYGTKFEPTIGPGVEAYTYTNNPVDEETELEGVQVPVPRDCRIVNTKGNCVWCSMELLARYAEIKELYDITKDVRDGGDRRCQGGSSSGPVREFLDDKIKKGLKIRYEMVTDKSRTDFLVRGCKIERRGVAFDIPGHMLTLVHYDPDTKIVKVIDNADRSLSVQRWTWEKFHRLWRGWAYIIYAENDIVPDKYITLAQKIDVLDHSNNQAFDKSYILMPQKD